MLGGAVPGYGVTDTERDVRAAQHYTVLNMAQQLALSRLPGVTDVTDAAVGKTVRNLVLTEDFYLIQKLQRYAREAVDGFTDENLAVFIANKRITDYKTALTQRNVLSMDSPGTYGWILHQDTKNVERIGRLPSFEELFAAQSVPDVARRSIVGERMTKIAYIPQDAPFNEDQRAWISGFLAGLHSRLAMNVNAPPPAVADQVEPGPSLRILYGTQTGNAEGVANDAAAAAKTQGFDVTVSGLDEIELDEFAGLKYVLIVTSTYGEGEMPDNAELFWEALSSDWRRGWRACRSACWPSATPGTTDSVRRASCSTCASSSSGRSGCCSASTATSTTRPTPRSGFRVR